MLWDWLGNGKNTAAIVSWFRVMHSLFGIQKKSFGFNLSIVAGRYIHQISPTESFTKFLQKKTVKGISRGHCSNFLTAKRRKVMAKTFRDFHH